MFLPFLQADFMRSDKDDLSIIYDDSQMRARVQAGYGSVFKGPHKRLPFERNRSIHDLLALNLNRHLLEYLSATFSMSCKEIGVNATNDISSASEGQLLATLSSFVYIDDCCEVSINTLIKYKKEEGYHLV